MHADARKRLHVHNDATAVNCYNEDNNAAHSDSSSRHECIVAARATAAHIRIV